MVSSEQVRFSDSKKAIVFAVGKSIFNQETLIYWRISEINPGRIQWVHN